MTPKEALQEITSKPKWYVVWDGDKRDSHKESTLRVTALRIFNGTAESVAMRTFFEKFGYELEINIKRK